MTGLCPHYAVEALMSGKEDGGAGGTKIDAEPEVVPKTVPETAPPIGDNENAGNVGKIDQNVIDYVNRAISEKLTEIDDLKSRLKDAEKNDEPLTPNPDSCFPEDTYSFVAFNCPGNDKREVKFLLFGLCPFFLQMVFIALLITYIVRGVGVIEADALMTVARFTAIVCFSLVPDSSLQDLVLAFQLWPINEEHGHRNGRRLSCLLRGIQGLTACVCAMLLIDSADHVIDIILNFAAMNFVSDIDDVTFRLASSGIFGTEFKEEADRIAKHELPMKNTMEKYHRYWLAMSFALVAFCVPEICFTALPDAKCFVYGWVGWQPQEDNYCYAVLN
eukprot:CAMPEP_0197189692 /NCGR_PEP_ID=MMETSP1423-20130617/20245_1 /TAXON_ID=476441 /ORGANISM="Pseudo-nitzschia heimii, Strain UNC1101" /LENGTH=331 /DNA_ID=CAMNT_0042641885 /DNA_START=70 /DNA_END=1065 /DNA_ORIENTATION=+